MCFRNSEYLVLLSRFATDSKYEIFVTNEAENRKKCTRQFPLKRCQQGYYEVTSYYPEIIIFLRGEIYHTLNMFKFFLTVEKKFVHDHKHEILKAQQNNFIRPSFLSLFLSFFSINMLKYLRNLLVNFIKTMCLSNPRIFVAVHVYV